MSKIIFLCPANKNYKIWLISFFIFLECENESLNLPQTFLLSTSLKKVWFKKNPKPW
jgi:hypothetical protein